MKICAGIVSFNPEIERIKKNIEAIMMQVEWLIVVDNASDNIKEIREYIDKYENCTLIENIDNEGIAKALNQLCDAAKKMNFDWILTMDQDTIIADHMVEEMCKYINKDEIGIVCPAVCYEGMEYTKPLTTLEYPYACMTSGSLTRIEAWKKVGGFREEYFIDFVDNEFCMKLRLQNYKILRVNACVMYHQLGTMKVNKFLLWKWNTTQHAPWRFYYMARNNYAFIREYKNNLLVLKEYLKLIYILLFGILYADEKYDTFVNILNGLKDARLNRMGKLNENKD